MKYALCVDPSAAHSDRVFVKEFNTVNEAMAFFDGLNLRFPKEGETGSWTLCAQIMHKVPHTSMFADHSETRDGVTWETVRSSGKKVYDIKGWPKIDWPPSGLWGEVYPKIKKEA